MSHSAKSAVLDSSISRMSSPSISGEEMKNHLVFKNQQRKLFKFQVFKQMANLPSMSVNDAVIEKATDKDIATIKSIVETAYSKYIDRLGKPPGPMTTDYNKLVNETQSIDVLRYNNKVVGCIILFKKENSLMIDNIVIDPSAQGRGFGRLLMDHAEHVAREQDLDALELYTNVKMWENVEMYPKMGFAETGRRTVDGFDRVFFRKNLG